MMPNRYSYRSGNSGVGDIAIYRQKISVTNIFLTISVTNIDIVTLKHHAA